MRFTAKKKSIGNRTLQRGGALFIASSILSICMILQGQQGEEAGDIASIFPSSTSTTGTGTVASWQSLHTLDCKGFSDGDDGVNVKTNTPVSFLMNIHDPKLDSVSSAIHKDGCWECYHVKSMLAALDKYPNSYFLDVGGNIGMWTLSAAAAGKQTFTIEPSVENYSRICKSVNTNGFHDRMHLMTIAASKEAATFHLKAPHNNKGGTHLVANVDSDKAIEEGVIKAFTIDSLNLPTDQPVVMKVDVEGHELDALLGAMTFLKNANIVYLAIELRPLDGKGSLGWDEVFKLLSAKGLVPFRVDGEGEEVSLDPNDLAQWRHKKHPKVRYYDVVWRRTTKE